MMSAYQNGTPAGRKYMLRTFAFMIPYMLICGSMMVTDAFDEIIGKPAGWILALAVSAPVIGQIWATLSLMRDSDEYMRAVIAKQFILAAGLAMALATFWGFAETFANAPHLPGWLIYAAFWGLYGCVAPFIKASN
jgi:putative oxidoreductase